MVTTTGAGFLFRCVQELRAIALSAQVCMDPEVLDVTTRMVKKCNRITSQAVTHPL
jgi:hypothetical protein